MWPDALLPNSTGGTDLRSEIVGGSPMQLVYEGEISGSCHGVSTMPVDKHGKEVTEELGQLVITPPRPSMLVVFWNDPAGSERVQQVDRKWPIG